MISNVAAAIDGSSYAQRAAEIAAAVAAKFGAKAHLIYVMPHHEVPADIKDLANIEHVEAGSIELEAATEVIVTSIVAEFHRAGVAAVEGHVLTRNPVATLLHYIQNHGIDMIFTGRRGLRPIEGVLLGSVSSKLNHHAGCTVVTVK